VYSDAEKTEIEDVMKLSDDEIGEKIASAEKAMKDAETTFKSEFE
jgi:hypothetical protein